VRSQFYPLEIESLHKITKDSISIRFKVPESLRERFAYLAGQHINLRVFISGEELRRSYSLHRAPHENSLEIAIKKVPGGKVSGWIFDSLEPGMTVDVMTPEGELYLKDATSTKSVLALASGSGITPILSIVKSYLWQISHGKVALIYGNRDLMSMMFREEILGLKNRYIDRFSFLPVFSRQRTDTEIMQGRIDGQRLKDIEAVYGTLSQFDAVLLCGPFDMIESLTLELISLGVDRGKIYCERFGTPQDSRHADHTTTTQVEVKGSSVGVTLDGLEHTLEFDPGSSSILDVGIAYGLDLPYSCKNGVCSTCKAKVYEGKVVMKQNYALTEEEIHKGFVLTCQSVPVTEKVVLSYDVRQ
jgi:ring-1,2-phenylacetyl-CoA epoxidase subunit PaaE